MSELYKKPIYVIRKDVLFPKDRIHPYGDRVEATSEAKRKKIALKLLTACKDEDSTS